MKLNLISSNLWLLPQPLSVDNKKRIDAFTDMCLEYRPDFILLQEVWFNSYVKYIKNKLSNYYYVGKTDSLFNQTGLILFSKHKPINSMKYFFKREFGAALGDILGHKGYLYVKFKIKNIYVDLLDIHLNCPENKGQMKAWNNQMETICRFVANRDTNLIIAGDFNGLCDRLEKESSLIVNKSEGVSSFSLKNPFRSRGFHSITKRFIRYEREELDIDQVFYFSKQTKGRLTKKLIFKPYVSDHYPVYAEVELD